LKPAAALRVREREAGHDGAAGEGLRQQRVVVGQRRDLAAQPRVDRQAEDGVEQARGRGAIRLGEHGVEGDDGGAALEEPVHQRRDLAARPRPLPDPREARIVDVHDAHRHVGVGTRRETLEAVEGLELQLLDGAGLGRPQEQPQPERQKRCEPGRSEPAHPRSATDAGSAGYWPRRCRSPARSASRAP
jgi:hypothetical protein